LRPGSVFSLLTVSGFLPSNPGQFQTLFAPALAEFIPETLNVASQTDPAPGLGRVLAGAAHGTGHENNAF